MKIRTLSFCLGLTMTTMVSSLPAQAASINLDELQLIPVRPIDSDHFLFFDGDPNNNEGQSPFLNFDPTAPDHGHAEISKNSTPGNVAPYYTTGRQSAPEQSGANRSATLEGTTGFTNFFNYLNNNNINFSEIGFGYGQKIDRDFTETWNLGDDLLGQDWLGSPDSTLEERIYQADPDAVESFLILGDTKFISFDYSPIYAILDKGETTQFDDDEDLFFTKRSRANKVEGLDPFIEGLADAFLEDVNLHGGGVQVVIEDSGVEDPVPTFVPGNPNYVQFNIRLPLTIRAVAQVPEPSTVMSLFLVGTFGALFNKRRQN